MRPVDLRFSSNGRPAARFAAGGAPAAGWVKLVDSDFSGLTGGLLADEEVFAVGGVDWTARLIAADLPAERKVSGIELGPATENTRQLGIYASVSDALGRAADAQDRFMISCHADVQLAGASFPNFHLFMGVLADTASYYGSGLRLGGFRNSTLAQFRIVARTNDATGGSEHFNEALESTSTASREMVIAGIIDPTIGGRTRMNLGSDVLDPYASMVGTGVGVGQRVGAGLPLDVFGLACVMNTSSTHILKRIQLYHQRVPDFTA